MRIGLSHRIGIGVAMVFVALLLATAWPGCITCKDPAARDRCEQKCRENCETRYTDMANKKNNDRLAKCRSDCPGHCLTSCW